LADLLRGLQGHLASHVVDGRAKVRGEQGPGVAQQAAGVAAGWPGSIQSSMANRSAE
jgi:hypothetical protein